MPQLKQKLNSSIILSMGKGEISLENDLLRYESRIKDHVDTAIALAKSTGGLLTVEDPLTYWINQVSICKE